MVRANASKLQNSYPVRISSIHPKQDLIAEIFTPSSFQKQDAFALLIWLIHLIRSWLRKWNHQLRQKLEEFTDALIIDPEATSSQNREKSVSDILDGSEAIKSKTSEANDSSVAPVKTTASSFSILKKLLNLFQKKARKNKWLVTNLNIAASKRFLQHQTLIKQKRNFCQLFLRLMLILEMLLLATL